MIIDVFPDKNVYLNLLYHVMANIQEKKNTKFNGRSFIKFNYVRFCCFKTKRLQLVRQISH